MKNECNWNMQTNVNYCVTSQLKIIEMLWEFYHCNIVIKYKITLKSTNSIIKQYFKDENRIFIVLVKMFSV